VIGKVDGERYIEKKEKLGFAKALKRDKYLVYLFIPCFLYYLIFKYIPMFGIVIAFQDYSPYLGYFKSEWVGLQNFIDFFESIYFWRLIRNTLLLNVYDLLLGFPVPIIFALLLNEVTNQGVKRFVQTVSYLPHFISIVIVVGIMHSFLSPNSGIVNILLNNMGKDTIDFWTEPKWFRPLYIGSGIWQGFGWGSIIYLAAISGIDPNLYEAAEMDGARRIRKMIHITIPGIMPTIVILLILRLGNMMSVGFQKIILMYNGATYETADVISTYVYRKGIAGGEFSFATAVGLFNSVINLILIFAANTFSRKIGETSLW
jgi:putative aldouronate transport system permease protein